MEERKYEKKNFREGRDGKLHIAIRPRTQKQKTDTYAQRSINLVKKAGEIDVTCPGLFVNLEVIPTWKAGKAYFYKSQGFPFEAPKKDVAAEHGYSMVPGIKGPAFRGTMVQQGEEFYHLKLQRLDEAECLPGPSQPAENAAEGGAVPAAQPDHGDGANILRSPVVGRTAYVAAKNNRKSSGKDICKICKIRHGSTEDNEYNSLWLKCCKKYCSWWAHAKCNHIYFPNTPAGQADLDRWSKNRFFCSKHMPN